MLFLILLVLCIVILVGVYFWIRNGLSNNVIVVFFFEILILVVESFISIIKEELIEILIVEFSIMVEEFIVF